ncbi:hypothetical protein L3N51_01399 [Metallosphaera sp. J1]|nr:hypothetical protein [Metallosphaera javensis (ex Hofmann et al. 2022)]
MRNLTKELSYQSPKDSTRITFFSVFLKHRITNLLIEELYLKDANEISARHELGKSVKRRRHAR